MSSCSTGATRRWLQQFFICVGYYNSKTLRPTGTHAAVPEQNSQVGYVIRPGPHVESENDSAPTRRQRPVHFTSGRQEQPRRRAIRNRTATYRDGAPPVPRRAELEAVRRPAPSRPAGRRGCGGGAGANFLCGRGNLPTRCP